MTDRILPITHTLQGSAPSDTSTLDPVIDDRLKHFRQRKRTLALYRRLGIGATAILCVLLAATFVESAYDESQLRWACSAVAYAVLCVVFLSGLLLFVRRQFNLGDEAAELEYLLPNLRHRLLSSIELAEIPARELQSQGVSSEFANHLEQDVRDELEMVHMLDLLPWRLVQRSVIAGTAACSLLAIMLCIPGLHLAERIQRILLPSANIGRIGDVKISLISPQPASKTVPRGDIIPITVAIMGGKPENVWLETRLENKKERRPAFASELSANRSSNGIGYRATLECTEELFEYRVATQDAYTAWHTIRTLPRPKATFFRCEITLPEQYPQATISVEQAEGNFSVLAGSQISLAIDVDQDLLKAELHWQNGTIESLELSSPNTYQLSFEATESTSYRLALQSRETGFTNQFSQSWQIAVLTDNPPIVEWLQPDALSTTCRPTELVMLEAQFTDEFPLAEISHEFRINTGSWNTQDLLPLAKSAEPLNTQIGTSGSVRWAFDLLQHKVAMGDVIEMRLRAKDKNATTTESDSRNLLISSTSINVERPAALLSKTQIADQIDELQQHVKTASTAIAQTLESGQDANSRSRSAAQLKKLGLHLAGAGTVLVQNLVQLTGEDRNLAIKCQTELAGRVLTGLSTRNASELERLANAFTSPSHGHPAIADEEVMQSTEQIVRTTTLLAAHFRTLLTFDVYVHHSRQLRELAAGFALAAQDQSLSKVELVRRLDILNRQIRDAQRTMFDSLKIVRPASQEHLRVRAESLSEIPNSIERRRLNKDAATMNRLADAAAQKLQAAALLRNIEEKLPEACIESLFWLRNEGQPIDVELANSVQLRGNLAALPTEVTPTILKSVNQNLVWLRALARAMTENVFAADLGMARRAVASLAKRESLSDSDKQTMAIIATSLKTLRATQSVKRVANHLGQLINRERWEGRSVSSATTSPLQWLVMQGDLQHAAKELRATQIPDSLADQLEQVQWTQPAQQARRDLLIRWQDASTFRLADSSLETVAEDVRTLLRQLKPFEDRARDQLRELSPSLQQLAQQAATESRKLAEHTESLQNSVSKNEVPDTETRVAILSSHLKEQTAPIEALREALVDEADTQELLNAEDLEKAQMADAAIIVTDQAASLVQDSLAPISEESLQPAQGKALAEQLKKAAAEQLAGSDAFQSLAESLTSRAEENTRAAQEESSLVIDPETLKPDPYENLVNQNDYEKAEELAELAQQRPEEVLQQLEQELNQSPAMQREMSKILKEIIQSALERLEFASGLQHQILLDLEDSDPTVFYKKKRLLSDLAFFSAHQFPAISFLLNEARWVTGTARQAKYETQLKQTIAALGKLREDSRSIPKSATYPELKVQIDTVAQFINEIQGNFTSLIAETAPLVDDDSHSNGAQLNNRRREMKDRARRVQQQHIRQMQQLERGQKQRYTQANTELTALLKTSKLEQTTSNDSSNASIASRKLSSLRSFRDSMATQHKQMQQLVREANSRAAPSLDGVNPTAQFTVDHAENTVEFFNTILSAYSHLDEVDALQALASPSFLESAIEEERSIEEATREVTDALARAARHEARLGNEPIAVTLSRVATETNRIVSVDIEGVNETLRQALDKSEAIAPPLAEELHTSSRELAESSTKAESALTEAANDLRSILANASKLSPPADEQVDQPQAPGNDDAALSPRQKAQMLDELDRMINQEVNFGSKEDDSDGPPAGKSGSKRSEQPASNSDTLSEAAKQLGSRLSRNREPLPASAQPDLGMATDSKVANMDPQSPIPVRVIGISRTNTGQWGDLRAKETAGTRTSSNVQIAPEYREQVEAYFRGLADRGHEVETEARKP